jgi:hypothetical protein
MQISPDNFIGIDQLINYQDWYTVSVGEWFRLYAINLAFHACIYLYQLKLIRLFLPFR